MNRRFAFRFLAVCAALATVVSCNDVTAPAPTSRAVATPILGNRIFTELALGDFHSCGLTAGGDAYCWGLNTQGQSGNGLSLSEGVETPLIVIGNNSFAKLYAGGSHSCGILTNGASMCWGNNAGGQLGTGSTIDRVEPTPVTGGIAFTALSASTVAHTCGLTAAGAVWCWGTNGFGNLGDGTTINRPTPVPVSGRLVFTTISAGGGHTCGLTMDGTAYCWGLNERGQLGDGTAVSQPVPTAVSTALKFRTIVAGLSHTCALTDQTVPYCWGDNVAGALGDGTLISRSTPTQVAGGNEFASIAVGERHGCGITVDGITLCWGYNAFGSLGDGTLLTRLQPVPLSVPILFTRIAAGGYHSCGISTSGVTYCWGDNSGHQLGAP